MSEKSYFVELIDTQSGHKSYMFLRDDLICAATEPVPHINIHLAKYVCDRIRNHTSAMTKGQLLDMFGGYNLEIRLQETDEAGNFNNSKTVTTSPIEPIAFQNGIITKGFESSNCLTAGNCLTVRELKAIVANWPEFNDDFDPTEVWIDIGDGLSRPCRSLMALNHRGTHADLILEAVTTTDHS